MRTASAAFQVLFSVVIVAREGPARAGVILAALAAIELAALIGRLGVPVLLTRRRSSSFPIALLPSAVVALVAVNAAIAGLLLGLVGSRILLVGAGSAIVAVNVCLGFWHRGASRFLLAAAAHPLGAILLATVGVVLDTGDPLVLYVVGALATTCCLAIAARDEIGYHPGPIGKAAAEYRATLEVGLAEIGNLLALRGIPVLLVAMDLERDAAVFELAVRAFRPLLIIQFAFGFIIGPALAERADGPVTTVVRSRLNLATGLLQLAIVPYAIATFFVVDAVADGFAVGQPLPYLRATWLVLLIGHVAIVVTGPTGQVLLMRDKGRAALAAAALGALASIVWFAIPFDPWLRASGALTVGLTVQTAAATVAAGRTSGWLPHPLHGLMAARQLVDLGRR